MSYDLETMEWYRENKQVAFNLIVDVYYLWHYLNFLYDLCECQHDFELAAASFFSRGCPTINLF